MYNVRTVCNIIRPSCVLKYKVASSIVYLFGMSFR